MSRITKLVPKRRFKEFQNIDAWEQRKLYEVAEFNPKSELPNEFEYVDLESVVGTEMISHRAETKSSAPSRAQRLAKIGDVFYQTVRPYQKNNYLFKKADNNYVFSTGYAQMRPNIDTTFLMSFLQTEAFVKVVLDNCTGTSYPAINSTDLSNLEISLPISRDEQRKVGEMLINLDNLITLHQRKLEKTKSLKSAYLTELFPIEGEREPKRRFAGFTDAWEQRKIQELIDDEILAVPMDGNHGEKHPTTSDYVSTGIPFIMARDICNGEVDLESCSFITKERSERLDKGFAKNGDVLLTHKATIGETAILEGLKDEYVVLTPQVTYYRILDESKLSRKFLYAFFNSEGFQNELKIEAIQSTRAYIGITDQHKLSVTLPQNIEEQVKIGDYFSNLDNIITLYQRKLEKLQNIKKAFLNEMFI